MQYKIFTDHERDHLDKEEKVLKYRLKGVHQLDPHHDHHGCNPLSFRHHQVCYVSARWAGVGGGRGTGDGGCFVGCPCVIRSLRDSD